MALVEAIAGKLGDQIEDVTGLRFFEAALDGAAHEPLALSVHFRLDLLAHGATQQIRIAQAVTRQDLGDLHHLFLVDDHAIGFAQNIFEIGIQIVDLFLAVFSGNEARDVVHGARAIKCHHGDDVFDFIGFELAQRITHALAFQLEDADGLGSAKQLVGWCVVERQAIEINLDPTLGQISHRVLQDRQRL